MVREKSSSIRRSLSYRVKPNHSNVYVKNIFLISGIRSTYKFIIPNTKRRPKDFLEFLKYWSTSHGLNKLVIKAKMHANIYIVFWNFLCCVKICCYNIYIYILERLGRMHENKIFFENLTKTGYFNTGLVSLQYKNTNRHWSKYINKITENHIFFEIIFEEFLFERARPGPKGDWPEIGPK